MGYRCLAHPENRMFVTGAVVYHDWLVDSEGDFIRDLVATDSEASAGDAWCAICDEVAEWVDEN